LKSIAKKPLPKPIQKTLKRVRDTIEYIGSLSRIKVGAKDLSHLAGALKKLTAQEEVKPLVQLIAIGENRQILQENLQINIANLSKYTQILLITYAIYRLKQLDMPYPTG
jgi:DNA mismatch repair ATPase MutS